MQKNHRFNAIPDMPIHLRIAAGGAEAAGRRMGRGHDLLRRCVFLFHVERDKQVHDACVDSNIAVKRFIDSAALLT